MQQKQTLGIHTTLITATMFPKYQALQGPLLAELARRGGRTSPGAKDGQGRTVYGALAEHFALPAAALDVEVFEASGVARSKWENMVRWARNDLRKNGLLDGSTRGIWAITEAGGSYLRSISADAAAAGTLDDQFSLSPEQLARLQAEAAAIGAEGELWVLEHERRRLVAAGRADLSAQLRQVSVENAAAGYDIASFEASGTDRLIEVKTSVRADAPFLLSANELRVARRHGASYWLYRVTDVRSANPRLRCLANFAQYVDAARVVLTPATFIVTEGEDFGAGDA